MKLLVISGQSGSGKSVSLNTLEDYGYYCIDNLPLGLLTNFGELLAQTDSPVFQHAAVGIDARNQLEDLSTFNDALKKLDHIGLQYEVIYLRAETSCLLKRFSETRRKHPLTNDQVSLAEAIQLETDHLTPIANQASLQIDTTLTNLHQLRELIRTRVVDSEKNPKLSVLIQSFGYKHGIPVDTDFVFDARCLPNPYWDPLLRSHTGRDPEVIRFLSESEMVKRYLADISTFMGHWLPCHEQENRAYVTISIGCTGGQHRSVFLAEQMSLNLGGLGYNIITRHREL